MSGCCRFWCICLGLHSEPLPRCGVSLMGRLNWFQFESRKQSVNHRRKEFQRQFGSSWNTSRYIFHGRDHPQKSLSFDINSPRGLGQFTCTQDGPGPVHIPSVLLSSQCPGRFTVSAALQTKRYISPDKYSGVIKHCVLLHRLQGEQQACESTSRGHVES